MGVIKNPSRFHKPQRINSPASGEAGQGNRSKKVARPEENDFRYFM
ncbi:MAG: hypothetical protein HLUCCX10_08145 [Algoriphagus marincola HL-49]|uniref:Uncharacterized protein n=1 Tax=Algoriphagus marincola HL-49 TaxID=1305737 RepID=A0A0P8AE57_9BACT|nr:MAG: hypothetical protein HLUCCX10_08145 [Algoriphagus marincola HL-49]